MAIRLFNLLRVEASIVVYMKQFVGIENIKDVLLHLLSNERKSIDKPIQGKAE